MSFQRLKITASSLLLSATILVSPVSATLQESLSPIPAHVPLTLSVKLEPQAWSYVLEQVKHFSAEEKEKFNDLLVEFKKATGLDLFNDLLAKFGSHLTFGFVETASKEQHVLISMNMKDSSGLMQLVKKAQREFQAQGNSKDFASEMFGPYEIFHLNDGEASKDPFGSMQFATVGQNLLLTIGPNADLLQDMIYIQTVLPADSRFKLHNKEQFQTVAEQLQDRSAWLYFDFPELMKLTDDPEVKDIARLLQPGANLSEKISDDDKILKEVFSLFQSFGLGLNIERDGLKFKSVTSRDPATLSDYQKNYFQQFKQSDRPSLNALLKQLPVHPDFLVSGRLSTKSLNELFPFDLSTLAEVDDFAKEYAEIKQGFKSMTQLDLEKDILQAIDGRYALSAEFIASNSVENADPDVHAVMYLGLKPEQAERFEARMQDFKLDPDALGDLSSSGQRARVSSVKANMHTLQTIVETFAVDWGGVYPDQLSTLEKEAAVTTTNRYWTTFANPDQPEAPSIMDFKDFKPGESQLGTVYYQGLEVNSGKGPDNSPTFDGYKIYGYGNDGKLYQMNGDLDLSVAQENLPVKSQSVAGYSLTTLGSHRGSTLYQFKFPEFDQTIVMARKGNLWLSAMGEAAIKQALDHSSQIPSYLSQNLPDLEADQYNSHFYLNTEKVGQFAEQLLATGAPELLDLLPAKDSEEQQLMESLAALKSISSSSKEIENASVGTLDFNIEMDAVDWAALGKFFEETSELSESFEQGFGDNQEEALLSSVRANMHTLQTILETYSVDWGGVYPDTVAELEAEAKNSSNPYWKSFKNPYTGESGEGQSFMSYSSFEAGNPGFRGQVLFKILPGTNNTGYEILGVDKEGWLHQQNGKDFILSNS